MSDDMRGNPHYGGADYHKQGTAMDQQFALIEATLALAFEQRTANLIAAFDAMQGRGGMTLLAERLNGDALSAQITEKLGLK